MLYEIICDKFNIQRIEFHKGLNTILGCEKADNSIGKSTFLLIVDFVFGGNDYADSTDISKNVGNHDIKFTFIFNEKKYYFLRNFERKKEVWICDSEYRKKDNIKLDKFCQFLDEKYEILMPELSFRNAVGRYMRVYGKDNLNEKLPLHIVRNEKSKEAIDALLKIFDLYMPIHNLNIELKQVKEKLDAYKKAQKHDLVRSVNKTQYKKNLKELDYLENEVTILSNKLENDLLEVKSEISEEAVRIKKELSNIRRIKNRLKLKFDMIEENLSYKFSISKNDYVELEKYFNDINLKKIEEVEVFHKNISLIVKNEIKSEKSILEKELNKINETILTYEQQIKDLVGTETISKVTLLKHANLIRAINEINMQNKYYNDKAIITENKKSMIEKYKRIMTEQLAILERDINLEMKKLNDFIYDGEFNAPIFNFGDETYSFFTPNDTGTGIAYKGMIIFDISVLRLTKLPILVHDTIIFKQTSDMAIERIFELYNKMDKQIIVAFDKQNSYTNIVNEIVNENSILELKPNGGELFGYSWGKQSK